MLVEDGMSKMLLLKSVTNQVRLLIFFTTDCNGLQYTNVMDSTIKRMYFISVTTTTSLLTTTTYKPTTTIGILHFTINNMIILEITLDIISDFTNKNKIMLLLHFNAFYLCTLYTGE